MGKILIKNCNLISLDVNRMEYEENIDILINNDIIEKIDKNIIQEDAVIIDASSKIVMPGLINTHAHLAMSIFKETAEGLNLQDWLSNIAWPTEAKMTEDDVYTLTLMSCIEAIKTGTTTVNNHYFMSDSSISAEGKIGINALETRCVMDIDGKGKERLEELKELAKKYKNSSNVKICVGIHGLYTSTSEYVKEVVKFANENNLLIHMHFCENTNEVKDIKNMHNVTNASDTLKKYSPGSHYILAHCVKLEDYDITNMRDLNVHVSHCPVSNLQLGCGIAKIKELKDNNINISLGTDGQGSGDNMDMFETMKFTSLLQKARLEEANVISPYEVIKMATVNGAKALDMQDRGSLIVGNKADIIILDLEKEITTFPVNNIFADIVYNAKGTNVITSIINGKIVMQDRKIYNINETEIFRECSDISKKLFNNI